MSTIARPASEKQVAFLKRLAGERDYQSDDTLAELVAHADELDVRWASRAIDMLMASPRKAVAHEDGNPVGEGYYFVNGLIYKVQAAKSSGNLYAKVFSEHGYEYAPGAMRLMATADRLTLEQAAEAGVKTGRCVVCARELTDPDSVAAGIGPVCATRL